MIRESCNNFEMSSGLINPYKREQTLVALLGPYNKFQRLKRPQGIHKSAGGVCGKGRAIRLSEVVIL